MRLEDYFEYKKRYEDDKHIKEYCEAKGLMLVDLTKGLKSVYREHIHGFEMIGVLNQRLLQPSSFAKIVSEKPGSLVSIQGFNGGMRGTSNYFQQIELGPEFKYKDFCVWFDETGLPRLAMRIEDLRTCNKDGYAVMLKGEEERTLEVA